MVGEECTGVVELACPSWTPAASPSKLKVPRAGQGGRLGRGDSRLEKRVSLRLFDMLTVFELIFDASCDEMFKDKGILDGKEMRSGKRGRRKIHVDGIVEEKRGALCDLPSVSTCRACIQTT
jgi:hypothetical protein